jgi:cytochrome b involved in lipid metabolism
MAHAGKDASAAFAAIGHSHMAKEAMMEFHVGYVDKQKRFTGLPDPIM